MKAAIHILGICIIGAALQSCEPDPRDAHDALIPKLGDELIQHHTSKYLNSIPPEVVAALSAYPKSQLSFREQQPDQPAIRGDAGLSFYVGDKCVLRMGLNLHESMKSYNLAGYEIP